MSDRRRTNSRPRATKQPATLTKDSAGRSPQSSARQRGATKRVRADPIPVNVMPTKRRRESVYDEVTIIEDTVEIDRCAICLDDCTEPKKLDKCGHTFCAACIDQYFESVKPQCPCCFTIYGQIRGNQPVAGTMTIETFKHRLPGFERDCRGTIRITYHFPDGIQDGSHSNPGAPYQGTTRQAFLPDNRDGREVLGLLQKAFDLRQIFTVGQSRTTGRDNVVTWNDIHHKTNVHGGPENFGYPDKTYLNRVRQELAAKGIK